MPPTAGPGQGHAHACGGPSFTRSFASPLSHSITFLFLWRWVKEAKCTCRHIHTCNICIGIYSTHLYYIGASYAFCIYITRVTYVCVYTCRYTFTNAHRTTFINALAHIYIYTSPLAPLRAGAGELRGRAPEGAAGSVEGPHCPPRWCSTDSRFSSASEVTLR